MLHSPLQTNFGVQTLCNMRVRSSQCLQSHQSMPSDFDGCIDSVELIDFATLAEEWDRTGSIR
jgi:hypothetical protein